MIRRAFADLAARQVHYRHLTPAQSSVSIPLLTLHASPGSGKQLEPLIAAMGISRRVIAPDTPGNGDSTKLNLDAPEIADYAAATLEFLDALELETVDVYGSHTGASIATELAILAPGRIRRVVLDGVGLFSAEERAEYLAHYAPAIKPDLNGAHLQQAFMFCRDQYLFWPWYRRAKENSRAAGLPHPNALHDWTVEVVKAIETYHLGYRAAFSYRKDQRLPLVLQPLLAICAEDDPLLPNTRQIETLVPGAHFRMLPRTSDAGFRSAMTATVAAFLDS
jgi:pimeloyl-ACP methyl ester carboxylesterase